MQRSVPVCMKLVCTRPAALLLLVAFAIPGGLAARYSSDESSRHIRARTWYEPYLNRPDGTPYNGGSSQLDLDAIRSGSFSAAFVGSIEAGKSRLIESLAQRCPETISGPPSRTAARTHTQSSHAYDGLSDDSGHRLLLIDTPGLEGRNLFPLQIAVRGLQDVRRLLPGDAPLKRLYFVVDASNRQPASVTKNLQLLRKAYGPDAACRVVIVLNKADGLSHLDADRIDRLVAQLKDFYRKVFPDSEPAEPLIVSAAKGYGQLLEDLARAGQSPTLQLDETGSRWCSDFIDDMGRFEAVRTRIGPGSGSHGLDLATSEAELDRLTAEMFRIDQDIIAAHRDADESKDDEVRSVWPDTKRASSVFEKLDPLLAPGKLDDVDTHLELFYLTMNESMANPSFTSKFMRRYNQEQSPAWRPFVLTANVWTSLKVDHSNDRHFAALLRIEQLQEQKGRKADEIADLSTRVSDLRLLATLQDKLSKITEMFQ